ncbi:hypothetical protein ACFZCP_12750 [Streptomyces sp. NPDC007971]|uniref:NHL domain-containing protein n=1 Tax=Streptomyces sp. NPDC007971 TaxID=3364799 RepID=UPI0036E0E707
MTATAGSATSEMDDYEPGTIWTIAGMSSDGFEGDGSAATEAKLCRPTGVVVAPSGHIYFSDRNNHRVRKIDPTGRITTIAGGGSGNKTNGQATAVELTWPGGLALDSQGNLYIADHGNQRVYKVVATNGVVGKGARLSTFAGGADDPRSRQATNLNLSLGDWTGLAVDARDNVYISDYHHRRVLMVTQDRVVSTVVGKLDDGGNEGDGGQVGSAKLNHPTGLAFDSQGLLYIADQDNHRVRRVDLKKRTIENVIGMARVDWGHTGDQGHPESAKLHGPIGLAIDSEDTVFVTCRESHTVRKVVLDSRIETIAGVKYKWDYNGDGFEAQNAQLNQPLGIALDAKGNLYIADCEHNRLREVIKVAAGKSGTHHGNGADDNTKVVDGEDTGGRKAGDETRLHVEQITIPQTVPGGGKPQVINVQVWSDNDAPVNPGNILHTFTAPDGYTFTGHVDYRYFLDSTNPGKGGSCDANVRPGGKVLEFTRNPHINADTTDRRRLVYTLIVTPDADARPGRYTNGSVAIGKLKPVHLTGQINPPGTEG